MQSIVRHASIKWRNCTDLQHGTYRAQSLQIGGKIYLGGGDTPDKYDVVQEYDASTRVWRELPKSTVQRAALAELKGGLVLAGNHEEGLVIEGTHSSLQNSTRISVWEDDSSDWIHPYPHMESGRSYAAAVGYEDKLIVACGLTRSLEAVGTVEVLDCKSLAWIQTTPVPLGGHHMSSVVIDKNWFLSAHYWSDNKPHLFCAHLPNLISNAPDVWCELKTPPIKSSTLAIHHNQLLTLGGLRHSLITRKDIYINDIYTYDPALDTWIKFGKLPIKMSGCSCVMFSSGELMVVGGFVSGKQGNSKQVWIGKST